MNSLSEQNTSTQNLVVIIHVQNKNKMSAVAMDTGDNNVKVRLLKPVYQMSLVVRKPVFGFQTRSNTIQAVQSQKMARGSKFRINKVEGSYCLCSENKGADQLRSYCAADLRLCFRICKNQVFSNNDGIW